MARHFSYQDDAALGAMVGQTLGRALFGDPAMAQAQQEHFANVALRDAQSAQANAQARLYGNRADIADIQSGAIKRLPDLFKSFVTPQAPPAAVLADPLAPLPEAGPTPGSFNAEAFRAGLPAVFASLAQARGENVDPNEIVGGIASMLGDDEMARRGLVTMGQTPGENFVLTPERADAISERDAREDLSKARSVENIESADRRYGVDVRSGDMRRGQDIRSNDTQRGQGIKAVVSAKRRPKVAVERVSSAARRMLFGVADDPEQPGVLGEQLKLKGWNLSREAKADVRANIVRRYQETGNPDEAVYQTLKLVGLRIEAKNAIAGGADRKAVEARFTRLTGQAL